MRVDVVEVGEEGLAGVVAQPRHRASGDGVAVEAQRLDHRRRRVEGLEAARVAVAGVHRRVGDEGGGAVAEAAEALAERRHAGRDAVLGPVVGEELAGVAAGEEGHGRRQRPRRLRPRLLGDDAAARQQLVDARRGVARVAVAGEVVGTQGVDDEQQHVGAVDRGAAHHRLAAPAPGAPGSTPPAAPAPRAPADRGRPPRRRGSPGRRTRAERSASRSTQGGAGGDDGKESSARSAASGSGRSVAACSTTLSPPSSRTTRTARLAPLSHTSAAAPTPRCRWPSLGTRPCQVQPPAVSSAGRTSCPISTRPQRGATVACRPRCTGPRPPRLAPSPESSPPGSPPSGCDPPGSPVSASPEPERSACSRTPAAARVAPASASGSSSPGGGAGNSANPVGGPSPQAPVSRASSSGRASRRAALTAPPRDAASGCGRRRRASAANR